jgi:hypothetical protein
MLGSGVYLAGIAHQWFALSCEHVWAPGCIFALVVLCCKSKVQAYNMPRARKSSVDTLPAYHDLACCVSRRASAAVRPCLLLQVLPALAPAGRNRQPAAAGDMRVFPSLVSGTETKSKLDSTLQVQWR